MSGAASKMTCDTMCTAALYYARQGIPVFPCSPKDKAPLVGADKDEAGEPIVGTGGFYKATTDKATITAWWAKWPNAMIGMPTGPASGIDVLDLDLDIKKGKDGFAAVPDWKDRSPVITRTPRGGVHLWFKSDGTIPSTSDGIALGVDTRGTGGYAILPPSRNGSAAYCFEKGNEGIRHELPSFPADLKARLEEQNAERTPNEDLTADPALIAAAMAVVPNNDVSQQEYNNKGMAIWVATLDDRACGFQIFDAWARKSKKYHGGTVARWKHYFKSPPSKIGAGSIIRWANEAQPDWQNKYCDALMQRFILPGGNLEFLLKKEWSKPENKTEPLTTEAPRDKAPEQNEPKSETPKSQVLSLQWHGDAPVQQQKSLIRNRLPEIGAGLLSGQWGTFKTFFALDLSAHIMMGWDWTGEPVYRQSGVLCLAQEGGGSIAMRLAALVEHKIEPRLREVDQTSQKIRSERLPFTWASRMPMLLGTDKNDPLPVLLATAELVHERFMKEFKLPLGLIWIDTLSSAGGFSDENDNAEAAKLMDVLRQLSEKSGAVVVGVDHLGKNVDAGSRGASAKEANSDFVFALLGTKDLAGTVSDTRLALRKMREGPSGMEIPFAPKVVDMGNDEHGYPLTSVVLDWNVKRMSKEKKTNAQQVLEAVLSLALKEHGELVKMADGREVRAVGRMQVLASYKAAYKPDRA